MIRVHKLNGQELSVNAEMIETLEPHGQETVICSATGNHFVVRENVEQVIEKIVEYRKSVYVGATFVPEFLRRA
jgi:flagellar protein FlbD